MCYLLDMVRCSADAATLTLTVHSRTPQRHAVNCWKTSVRSCERKANISAYHRTKRHPKCPTSLRSCLLLHVAVETQEVDSRILIRPTEDRGEEHVEELDGLAA